MEYIRSHETEKMFEVGKVYEIRIGDVVSFNCVVLDFDENNGLLKISQNGKIRIINVRSSEFIEARPQE